ncbi:glycosyltransferase family 87 protein [Rugosimonospora acidiphila]
MDAPSRSDEFVRGISEVVGGPMGTHATGGRRRGRFWTATRIVLALVCLTLALHWVQKSPCQDGAWGNGYKQYREMCYTDVLALYYAEGLSDGQVPYADHAVEYPVLTGAFMGLIGLPVHALGVKHPGLNQGEWFYNANVVVLGGLAVASVVVLISLRRKRPWDAALFAASPALLVTATVNWDLLAVGFAMFGVYAWSKRHPVLAGVLLGLGTAAKLWPGFLFIPLLLLGLRGRRFRDAFVASVTGLITWIVVNAPVYLLYRKSWDQFFHLNSVRAIDWGTLWYLGVHFPFVGTLPGFGRLQNDIPAVNFLQYGLFAVCCVLIGLLILTAPRRPRLGQVAFLVVAAFLVFSKVWSQQYVLWLLPMAVLARPRWGAFLAWQAAEVVYFCAFYGELLGASGKGIFPETVFDLAALLRLIMVCVFAGYVVRDILHPERDVVRDTYADDPEGGVLDGAPDAPWIERWRVPVKPDPAKPEAAKPVTAEPATT